MNIEPIARIHTDFPTKFGVPRQSGLASGLVSTIVFEPPYRNPDCLRGIADFSHLWLIWEFDKVAAPLVADGCCRRSWAARRAWACSLRVRRSGRTRWAFPACSLSRPTFIRRTAGLVCRGRRSGGRHAGL